MSIKPDFWIRRMALEQRMIEPFVEGQVRPGHDLLRRQQLRLRRPRRRNFSLHQRLLARRRRPQELRSERVRRLSKGDVCIIPPNSFALAETVEYFEIPRDVLATLPGQVDLCPLRHHRQRDAAGAGMARQDHHRDQQHDAAARQDLRQRRRGEVTSRKCDLDDVCETSYKP